jgi:hypothetical protein
VGGALAPVADHNPGISGSIGSGVWGSRMACLEPGRQGVEITSGRRDARGLTFSVVIPARVMQPGGFNRRESELAYRSLRLRDGVRATPPRSLSCVASLAHLRCAHRLG